MDSAKSNSAASSRWQKVLRAEQLGQAHDFGAAARGFADSVRGFIQVGIGVG